MQTPPRLSFLRYRLRSIHDRSERERASGSTISPWTFLALPIYERLILMARGDSATAYEVHRALGFAYADTSLGTDRMELALHRLRESMATPFQFLEGDEIAGQGYDWAARVGAKLELRWRQLFYPQVAMCLFGESMPPVFRTLTLGERACLYCVLYEELEWVEIEALLGCTEHFIRRSIRCMMEAMETATLPVRTP